MDRLTRGKWGEQYPRWPDALVGARQEGTHSELQGVGREEVCTAGAHSMWRRS